MSLLDRPRLIGVESTSMRALLDESTNELDAEFDLAFEQGSLRIVLHARGGSQSAGGRTNPDYERLLQLLLERLKIAGCQLLDVRLASRQVAHLPAIRRRIELRDFPFPVDLGGLTTVVDLRYAIRRAAVTAHSKAPIATHGNATRRIEIIASCPMAPGSMVDFLHRGTNIPTGSLGEHEAEDDRAYWEGRPSLRTHLLRERNRALVSAAKAAFRAKHDRLFCEVCGFDFETTYGSLGASFIEAHHESALAEREESAKTRIQDLRMVCANCHRMLHRAHGSRTTTIDELRQHFQHHDRT